MLLPIISNTDIVNILKVSKTTASTLIKEFEDKNIVKEITGYQRNKTYIFDKYLKIYSPSLDSNLDYKIL
jgi:DNA-binding transcriptional regulator GbsR (MarR family)